MLNCCTVVVVVAVAVVVVVVVVVTTILCEKCCCDCSCICKCCTVVCCCYCCCCFLYRCCCLVCFVVFFIVVVVCCVVVVFLIAVVVSLSFWGLAMRDFVDLVNFSQKTKALTCAWQEYLGLSRQILASFRPRSRRPMCQRQADQVDMIMFRPGDPLNFSWQPPGVSQAGG